VRHTAPTLEDARSGGLFDDHKPVRRLDPASREESRAARTSSGLQSAIAKRPVSTKSAADYIEELFQLENRPLTTSELAELLPSRTDFVSHSTHLPNTLRTAMYRNPDRFIQLDKFTWGLSSKILEWQELGLLPDVPREEREEIS